MRKKLLKTLIASLVICSFSTATAFAQSAVVNGSYVNMRAGPGMEYIVMECLAKGTPIDIIDSSNTRWYAISYNGQIGYISSDYVSITQNAVVVSAQDQSTANVVSDNSDLAVDSSSSINAPTPTPTPTVVPNAEPTVVPASTPAPTSEPLAETSNTGSSMGTITGDYVRFRTGPGTTYTIITMYNKGQNLAILSYEGDWVKCTINGREGYVSKQYVKESSSESNTVTVAVSPAPIEEITSPVSASNTGASDSLTSTDSTNTEAKVGYISGNNVRFRTGPDLNSQIIKEFYYGNSVTITGTSGEWTAVSCDDKTGYVFSQYVKEGSYSTVPSSTANNGTVTGSDIVSFAMNYLGYSYKYGGQDPSTGFDCSGFVYYVYSHFGYVLNRTAQDQSLNGNTVSAADLKPGDILCFYTSGNSIGHSGIYIGDNKFIHAANSNTGVIITQLSGYYSDRGYVAKRIL